MGWQTINTVLNPSGTQDFDHKSLGFLQGTGNEDDYYCFTSGPHHPRIPYIAKEWAPHLKFDGNQFSVADYLFNGQSVYTSSAYGYVFYSTWENSWVWMQYLREPYYYTDIDGETIKGDVFYKGNFPDLNDGYVQWSIAGNTSDNSYLPQTKDVSLEQDYWEWYSNGAKSQSLSGFCGKYHNSEDDSWKFVGIPTFLAYTQQGHQCYYTGEIFSRSFEKDPYRHYTYDGDKGHSITRSRTMGIWVLGQVGHGKWSECSMDPSLTEEIQFTGYQLDEGTHVQVRDPKGDFILKWNCMEMGDKKNAILMGEVSLWRRMPNQD